MNPISLAMDGLLAVLLLTAVAVGVRLNGKLKLLREGQGQFVKAVGDLDVAAARAEGGLQALRSATEEAHDVLLARIETARALLPKLDRAVEEGAGSAARLDDAVRVADAAERRARAAAQGALDAAERASARSAALEGARPAARPRLVETDAPPAADLPVRSPARGDAPIPFPGLERKGEARGLAAALRAAERIVEAESEPERVAPESAAYDRGQTAAPRAVRSVGQAAVSGGDRLARFVARRRSARV